MDLAYLLFLILFFSSLSYNDDFENQTLSIKTTTGIQCILTILVILHHVFIHSRSSAEPWISNTLLIMGRLAVSLFFFISGYGIFKQYKIKGKIYIENFWRKRIIPVLLSFLIAFFIYFIYYNIHSNLTLKEAFNSIINGAPFINNSWYIIAVLFFYLFFYIIARFSVDKNLLILLLFLVTFIFFVSTNLLGYSDHWYNAIFSFPIGALWAFKEKEITNILFKNYKLSCVGSAILFSVFFYLDEVTLNIYFRELSCIFFAITSILISYRFYPKSIIFKKMKNISFEMYLYHGLIINLLRSDILFISNRFIFACLTIFFTVIISYFIKIIELVFKKILYKSKSKLKLGET